MPNLFRCPADTTSEPHASYLVIVGPNTAFVGGRGVALHEITDGTSNTFLVVEVAGSKVNWMEPKDLKFEGLSLTLNSAKDGTAIRVLTMRRLT